MQKRWNILIIPNTSEQGYNIALSASTIRLCIIVFTLLIIGASLSFGISVYTWKNENQTQVNSMVDELQTKRDELEASRTELVSIKEEFEKLMKLEGELRSLAGLKPRRLSTVKDAAGGQGGPELVDSNVAENGENSSPTLLSDVEYPSGTALMEAFAATRDSLSEIRESLRMKRERIMSIPSRNPVASPHAWISSGFGYREDPLNGRRTFHEGLDIVAPRRTPIVATADGVVTFAGRLPGLGNTVKIKHRYGYYTTYGHNDKIMVKRGDHVKRGDVISLLGSTGRSTGPHLHYEIRHNGKLINPYRHLVARDIIGVQAEAKFR